MRDDVPSLRSVAIVHAVERSFADACARKGFRLAQYSLQGNHAHLIVEARDREALGRGMKSIAARLARAVNRVAERHGRVLVDRYHVRMLRTPREVHHALRYVLLNGRRHASQSTAAQALRDNVRLDPASSARWFEGWLHTVPSAGAPTAGRVQRPPVARARTWLLTVGWRRHGLLDPADIPG
jgi:REP element-mobilizing transposase RayT